MTQYIAEVEFKTLNWDTITVEADDREQAEQFVTETVMETNDDAGDVTILTIKEVNIG